MSDRLAMKDIPVGDDPVPGDIGCRYAPWGNVVFDCGDVGNWNGIAGIGQFDSSTDLLEGHSDEFTPTIELAE